MDSSMQNDIKCEIKEEHDEISINDPDHTNDFYYKCNECQFVCTQNEKLNDHKKFAHPSVDESDVVLNFEEQINDLSQISKTLSVDGHQQLDYACSFCGKIFPKIFRLKRHIMTVHTDYRPFGCDMCDKRFKEKSHLKTHCKNVHKSMASTPQSSVNSGQECNPINSNPHSNNNDAPVQGKCEINLSDLAPSNEMSLENVKMHESCKTSTHPNCSDFFKYSNRWKRCLTFCEKCHVEFKDGSSFIQHTRLCCRICHFETLDHTALIKHGKAHLMNFPVSCGKCGLFFKTFSRLKLHQSFHHANIFPYKCNRCTLTFQYRSHLLKHKYNTYRIYTEPPLNVNLKYAECAIFDSNSLDLSSSNSTTIEQSLASLINQNRLYPDKNDDATKETYSNEVSKCNFEDHEVVYKTDCRNNRSRFLGYPRTILCDYCRKPFHSQEEVDNHKFIAPPDRPFKCSQCCKSFKKKGHLTDHVRIHGEASLYQCDFCDKSFKRRAQLVSHIHYTHKNTRRLSCPHCGKVTKSTHGYKAHLLSHTNQRPEVCEICGRTFKSKMHLRSHVLSHGVNFPFKCQLCDMGFRERHRLNRHMLVHTESKQPFQCDKCDKSFPIQSLLLSHLVLHGENTTYTCKHCEKSFKLKKYLDRHLHIMHGIERPLKPLLPM